MHTEIVLITQLVARELSAWKELAARAISPNPFMEPDYVLPAMRAWRVDDLGILVVRQGHDWLAAVPVRQARSFRGVPGRCLVAWRHDYCYLGTPLVAGDDPRLVSAALLARGLRDFPSVAFEWVDADGSLGSALSESLATESRPVELNQFDRAALRRTAGDLELRVSRSSRRTYARRRRQLEGEVGPLTARDESTDVVAYERFLEIERSGWKGKVGTAMACRPGHGEFFVEVCRRFAKAGRLQMLSLANDHHTVAMACDLIAGTTRFALHACFDETFTRFSPGIQLEFELVPHFNAGGYQLVDSCTAPYNTTLNKLWPARRRLRSVIATARRPGAVPAYAKWQAAAPLLPLRYKLRRPAKGTRGR